MKFSFCFKRFLILLSCSLFSVSTWAAPAAPATTPAPTSAQPKGYQSYEATMKMSLPVPAFATKKSSIVFPQPGQISYSAQRYCGDGDVVNYYESGAGVGEDSAHGRDDEQMALGYWVVFSTADLSGTKMPAPKKENWFLVGYSHLSNNTNDLQIDGNVLTGLYPADFQGGAATALSITDVPIILKDQIPKIFSQFNHAPNGYYYINLATMVCNAYIVPTTAAPSAASVAQGMIDIYESDNTDYANKYTSGTASSYSGSFLSTSVSIDPSGNPIMAAMPSITAYSAASVSAHSASVAYDASVSASMAAGAAGAATWGPLVAAAASNSSAAAASSAAASSSAFTALLSGSACSSSSSVALWWESAPMNLLPSFCQDLRVNPSVANVAQAAYLYDFQTAVNTNSTQFPQNKARCFDDSSTNYNKHVIASLPFSFSTDNASGTAKIVAGASSEVMKLPEGNYISVAPTTYNADPSIDTFMIPGAALVVRVNSGNFSISAVKVDTAGMVTLDPDSPNLNFASSLPNIPLSLPSGRGDYFPIHIRDYGCNSGPTYCGLKPDWDSIRRIN